MKRFSAIVVAFVCTLFLSGIAVAQVTTGDILGTVTDSSGAVVPGAAVTITNLGTQDKRTMQATASGEYVFNFLNPGRYSVHVEAQGFKATDIPEVNLSAGDRAREDATLQVGAATETVEVKAETPALQTDTATVQDVVTEQAVQDLPLNGRNLVGLVQSTAGVNQGGPAAISSGNRPDDRRPGFTISANGQNDLYNNVQVDGLDNNEREQGFSGIRPSVDGISEVRVLTNDYSAEIGRNAGAVVNILTKSGSNEFHGSAYEYFRNDVFDAKDFFDLSVPEYRQNQFGGSIGGPIKKNKTFFFGDIEETRTVQGLTYDSSVPTLFEEQHPGNFSDIGGPVLTAGQISPVALKYFQLYPAPNRAGSGACQCVNDFVDAPGKTQFSTVTDERVDHRFGDKDSIFGRYGYNRVSTFTPGNLPEVDGIQPGGNFFGFAGPSSTIAHNAQLDYVHIFRPTFIMELRGGYTRIDIATYPLNFGKNLSDQFGIINGNISSDSSGLSPMYFSGSPYASLGDGVFLPIIDVNNTFQENANFTWTHGAHNVKFGATMIRRQLNYFQDQWSPHGGFIFPSSTFPLADFLQGNTTFFNRGNDFAEEGLRSWEPSLYVQDDWRVRSWLTLNLGLRWETITPFSDSNNAYTNFDMSTLSVVLASNSNPTVNVKTDWKDYSPRIGFAATLGHNMVLRGGFGMSYYPTLLQSAIQPVNPPFGYSCFFCTLPAGDHFPVVPLPTAGSVANPTGSVTVFPPNLKQAYLEMFNLFLQKQFGNNTVSIGGVSELGRRLEAPGQNLDRPQPPGPGNPTPGFVYAAQLPAIQNINLASNNWATSEYNALQVQFTRRYSSGITFNVNYTWAHAMGDSYGSSANGNDNYGLVTGDPHYDYGNSDLDIRHRIAIAFDYDLPFGKSMHGIAHAAIADWQFNAIGFWETGLPFTVEDAVAHINLPNVTTDRPNWVGNWQLPNPDLQEWFNVNAFAPQVEGTPGNEAVNVLHGPHQRLFSVSLVKNFVLHENWRLQFRAEGFNISNTPNFNNPLSELGASGYGQITSTVANSNPRQLQFALKLLF